MKVKLTETIKEVYKEVNENENHSLANTVLATGIYIAGLPYAFPTFLAKSISMAKDGITSKRAVLPNFGRPKKGDSELRYVTSNDDLKDTFGALCGGILAVGSYVVPLSLAASAGDEQFRDFLDIHYALNTLSLGYETVRYACSKIKIEVKNE